MIAISPENGLLLGATTWINILSRTSQTWGPFHAQTRPYGDWMNIVAQQLAIAQPKLMLTD
jgi:hypothetical protein